MLKLARLPDRVPVKLALSLAPDLHDALTDYAAAYQQAHGRTEPLGELIPAMLAAFIESDRDFARWRQNKAKDD